MKQSRYSEEQIIGILKQAEAGARERTCAVSMAYLMSLFINGAPSLAG